MPFTTTDRLNPNADVTILFSGLLILEPQDDGTCQVFVNSSAPRHYLTIEVRRKRAGRPDEFMMRHIGPLAFFDLPEALLHGMLIKKVFAEEPRPVSVYAYAPVEPQPEGAPDGLNLAVDMKSARMHPENRVLEENPETHTVTKRLLDIDPLGGRPSILLNDGVLYTAAKTREDFEIRLKRPDGADEPMPPFASLIGAAITLEEDSHVVIQWRQQGQLQGLNLRKSEGVTYEIYIVNDPLFESDSIADLTTTPTHDEFAEYYKLFHRVPSNEQFRLEVKPLVPAPERGSSRAPCMPVIVNGGG